MYSVFLQLKNLFGFSGKYIKKNIFLGKKFKKSKFRDSSFVVLIILHLLCLNVFLYLQNCRPDSSSRETFFWAENGRTWLRSDVICGQPIIAFQKFLVTICKIDAREGTECLVTIGVAVLEIYRKVWRGGGLKSPPRGRRLSLYPSEKMRVNWCVISCS